jgi:chromosome segregation ATPase
MSEKRNRESLERINQQQNLLIQVLCDAYNSPRDRGQLFLMLQTQFAQSIAPKSEPSPVDVTAELRVQELERQLREQDEAYLRLQKRLQEYNDVARHYEDELARVGEGNARLLESFQQKANALTDSEELRSLDQRGKQLERECAKLERDASQHRSLMEEIQDQIHKSRDEYEALQKQVKETKQELESSPSDDPSLRRQIAEQERLIEDLNHEIDRAKETIAQLKRENQSLRDRLENADSDD